MRARASLLTLILLSHAPAIPAAAAPAMFEASFIFHAWGNDVTSGTPWGPTQYLTNDWTAAPLGYDCGCASPFTVNGGVNPRWCSNAKRQKGHPATGSWLASLGTGAPPGIALAQSAFGVTATGIPISFPPYLQDLTYATFVNDAGSFYAGGGAAADAGYVNKTAMTHMGAGTWRIRAGKNAFGGVMGLLGKYGATGKYTVSGAPGIYTGVSSWNMVKAIGRPRFGTRIGTGDMGTPLYQNPYTKTDVWYNQSVQKSRVLTAIGSGTLWTTGQVGNFVKTGAYFTSLYRTGYDNRTPGGVGTIQLVTPTLTHWLGRGYDSHSAQVGLLKLVVTPEPAAVLLLGVGAGALLGLRRIARRSRVLGAGERSRS